MTFTQYLIAWSVYILAAIGCLFVWWRMTRPLNPTFASWLRLIATVLVLTPGFTSQEMTWLSPGLLAIAYEFLSTGPEGLAMNGTILGGTLAGALLIKLLFFRRSFRRPAKQADEAQEHNKSDRASKASASQAERREPRLES
ncbi:hypothetical protein [Parendozoicomonas haliclonae]|uniref:Uncharacterized protein n=1 Tax=Parendozoicomonas haliclonae TaxID=1960125 RepID=A0A1X7AJV5_9GAMM|nr:hypothetical protein [Parendozoicomonas haliclonae]SMA47277.1 hypothetical protein EHSB41UT_02361 [Parendozoicomonas haliclonae]